MSDFLEKSIIIKKVTKKKKTEGEPHVLQFIFSHFILWIFYIHFILYYTQQPNNWINIPDIIMKLMLNLKFTNDQIQK